MSDFGKLEPAMQRRYQLCRQQRRPVYVALAGADQDLAASEIDVLHPQPQAFHQAHAGPIPDFDSF
jgi:hypothetical protein